MLKLSTQPNDLSFTKGSQLIYLISQPRSGSTLLQRVLGGHSDIHFLSEPWIMLHPIYALKEQGLQAEYGAGLARVGLEDFITALPGKRDDYLDAIRAMASTWYSRALKGRQETRFLDKTPRYYYIIPELHEVFPESKIILLFRNPLAVLSSVLNTWVGKNWSRLQLHRDDILRGPALMVAGKEALKGKAIVLRYEDFVRAPEARLKHLCGSLSLSFASEMLDYGSNKAPSGRMGDCIGIHQANRPTPASLNKWKETFKDPVYKLLAEITLTLIGSDIVGRMGYSYNSLWQELHEIEPANPAIPKAEIVAMVSSLSLSKEKMDQISHLFAPYLAADAQAHASERETMPA